MLAVFDQDVTLPEGDSAALWLWGWVRHSPLRAMAVMTVLPLTSPMDALPLTRCAGVSILLWIATAGLFENGLRLPYYPFGESFWWQATRAVPAGWRHGGFTRASQAGDRVVAVTAAPALLAWALICS